VIQAQIIHHMPIIDCAGRIITLLMSDHCVMLGEGRSDDEALDAVAVECSSETGAGLTGPSIGERLSMLTN